MACLILCIVGLVGGSLLLDKLAATNIPLIIGIGFFLLMLIGGITKILEYLGYVEPKLTFAEQVKMREKQKEKLKPILASMNNEDKYGMVVKDLEVWDIKIASHGFVIKECVKSLLKTPEKLHLSPRALAASYEYGNVQQWSEAKQRIIRTIDEILGDEDMMLEILYKMHEEKNVPHN